MAKQHDDAFDAADSPDELATEQAPLTSANTPLDKPNKQLASQKAFGADTSEDDAALIQSAERLDTTPRIDYGTTPDEAALKLEEQGFSEVEALRLLNVSDRATHSKEALEAQETQRRLNFTRWLIERGLLSEFPA